MSKFFIAISMFALLFSVGNCAIRGPKGEISDKEVQVSAVKYCALDLELKPTERCAGPGYVLSNRKGKLVWEGDYFETCSVVPIGGEVIDEN